MPVSQLSILHGDPATPVPAVGEAVLLTELNKGSIDAFVESATSDAAQSLLSVEPRHLGGALRLRQPDGGALNTLTGAALLFAVGSTPTSEIRTVVAVAAGRIAEAVNPAVPARL